MARICELCKTENDDDSQFCEKCGNPLVDEVEEEAPEGEEVEAEPAAKPQDLKLLAIPAALVVIILIVFLVFKMQSGKREKNAKLVMETYMKALQAENYNEALMNATGTGLSAAYEKSFKEFVRQLTPEMPINDQLRQCLLALSKFDKGMEKYYRYKGKKFPNKLKELVPNYIKEIPKLPGGYEYGYKHDNSADNYTVFIKGKKFEAAGLPENFPVFSKKGYLQAPGRKFIHGEWKIQSFEILDVQSLKKDEVKIRVKENVVFGPSKASHENIYSLQFKGGKWMLDPESSTVNLFSLTNAYNQMKDMGAPAAKKPEPPEEKKPPPKGEKPKEKEPPKKTYVKVPLGMILLTFSKIARDPKNLRTRTQYQYRLCKDSLEDLKAALTAFSNNHGGKYPDRLLWLVPKYIDKIPLNLAAGEDTFSAGYQLNDDKERFTIVSQGEYFISLGIKSGFPLYSSKFRIIEKESDIPEEEPEPSPEPSETPEEEPTPGEETPGEETPLPGEEASPSGEETPPASPAPVTEGSPSVEEIPETPPTETPDTGKKPDEGKTEATPVKPDEGKGEKPAPEKTVEKKDEDKKEPAGSSEEKKTEGKKVEKTPAEKEKSSPEEGKERKIKVEKESKDGKKETPLKESEKKEDKK